MGILDFLQGPNMDEGIREYHDTEGAVLLDVRTPEEFAEGHVPGSINIPLQELNRVTAAVPDQTTPLFVYCTSGVRSKQATDALQNAGYKAAKNIGGIKAYTGEVER